MSLNLNKLTLLSVGIAGMSLVACGPNTKEGDPKPVDSTTVRQSIVGNTRTMAADFSRTAKFLEVSSILTNGIGFASAGTDSISVCTATPDGVTDCQPETTEPTALDLDINDETDDIVAQLERTVLADANVESSEEFAITYLIKGDVACAQDGQPLDQECVDAVDAAQIRLVVTSPASGDVDVDVLVGPNRVNPLSLQIHQHLLAAQVDLGAVKDSAELIAGLLGETADLPATFEGKIRAEMSAPSDHEIKGSLSVLQAVKIADGTFSLSVGQSTPFYAVTLDSSAKTLLGEGNVGVVDGQFPISSYAYDSATDVETETIYDLGFHIAGATGTTLLDVASEVLTLTGMGLGPDSTTVSIDGNTVATIDLNPADGRTLDATVTVDDTDAVKIEVDPKFDLRLALQMANAVSALDNIDDWMLDEVLNIRLDGAAKPTVLISENQVEVLDGTLTMEMENAQIVQSVTAGQCLLSPSDAPIADSGSGDPVVPVEESTNPLDDVLVGACQ